MNDLLSELAESSRRAILEQLQDGPKNVSELVEATGMKQPNLSNHLSKLRLKNIVKPTKIGRQVYYALATPEIARNLQALLSQAARPEPEEISLGDAVKTYSKLAIQGDEAGCAEIVDQMIRQGFDTVQLYQNVLAGSMEMIGAWYQVEAVDEGQEHLASAITERMMARVMQFAPPLPAKAKVAVLGCVPGNYHSIGLRMISDFLRLKGWKVVYLGANVPTPAFLSSVKEHEPNLVLVSCAREEGRTEAIELVRELKLIAVTKGFMIGVGGRYVNENPDLFVEAGANFTASDLQHFSEVTLPTILTEARPTVSNGHGHGNGNGKNGHGKTAADHGMSEN